MSHECECVVHTEALVLAGHKTCLRVQRGSQAFAFM